MVEYHNVRFSTRQYSMFLLNTQTSQLNRAPNRNKLRNPLEFFKVARSCVMFARVKNFDENRETNGGAILELWESELCIKYTFTKKKQQYPLRTFFWVVLLTNMPLNMKLFTSTQSKELMSTTTQRDRIA